jgi:hypothetical protein
MLRRFAPQHDKKGLTQMTKELIRMARGAIQTKKLFEGVAVLFGFHFVAQEVGGFGGAFEGASAARGGEE